MARAAEDILAKAELPAPWRFPPPLWGRAREGGTSPSRRSPPPPSPPCKGKGRRHAFAGALFLALAASPALAAPLAPDLPPGARQTVEVAEARVTYQLPVGVWDGTRVPVEAVDGDVVARAYRIEGAGQATLDLMAGLRRQLQAAGYSVRLDCEVRACGGFDFRFAVALLPEPEMHVDLGDFRALAASKGGEHVFVVASRSENAGFVQITTVSPAGTAPQPVAEAPAVPDPTGEASIATSGGAEGARPDATDLAAALERDGHVVLGDLVFATGSSALGEGEFASLAALAAYLAANPGAQVALVGHTDAEGSLAANIAVSEARARSVRERLIAAHGADPARLTAEGVGYLAPLAPNATAEGRQKNRRVEAVLTSTR